MSLIVPIVSVALLAGAALVCIGLRGRKVSEHPHCRKCAFDLDGLIATDAATSDQAVKKCPECGADLMRARAVRMGQCAKRWGMIAPGAAVLVAGIASAALVAGGAGWQARLNKVTPNRILAWEAKLGGPLPLDGVLSELMLRHASTPFSGGDLRRLCDALLKLQPQPGVAWKDEWGDVIEGAWLAGVIDTDTMRAYLDRGTIWSIECHPQIAVGRSVSLGVTQRFSRVGYRNRLVVRTSVSFHDPKRSWITVSSNKSSESLSAELNYHSWLTAMFATLNATAPGRVVITMGCELQLVAPGKEPVTLSRTVKCDIESVEEKDVQFTTTSDSDLSEWVVSHARVAGDSSDRGALQVAVTATGRVPNDAGFWHVHGQVRLSGQVPSAFSLRAAVFIRIDGNEYRFGVIALDASGDIDNAVFGGCAIPRLKAEPPRAADIIVRFDRDVALDNLGAKYPIWTGEAVLPNVELVPDVAPSRPVAP